MYRKRWAKVLLDHQDVADPQADDLIEQIYHQSGKLETINEVFKSLVRNEDIMREELPIEICTYLDATNDLPEWANQELLELGSNVFSKNAAQIVLILHLASLPVLYAADRGAQLLYLTQQMTSHIERRICETAQFVLDVTEDNAFAPQNAGIVTTQKVRLMHAAVRHFIRHDPKWRAKWQDRWGEPISQSALTITMLSFSTVVIQCLEKSGIIVTKEEKEAYLHLWKVVGHILGIHRDLMPKNYRESLDILDTFRRIAYGPTDEGRALTKVLIEFVQRNIHGPDNLITDWMRFWLDDDLCDMLGIPAKSWTSSIIDVIQFTWKVESVIEHVVPLDERITDYLSHQLLEGLLTIERGGNRPHFRLPRSLQQISRLTPRSSLIANDDHG